MRKSLKIKKCENFIFFDFLQVFELTRFAELCNIFLTFSNEQTGH